MSAQTMDLRALRNVKAPAETDTEPGVKETPREYSFRITYTDPNGVKHSTSLLSRILEADEMTQRARRAAILSGGLAWASFPQGQQIRMWALANVSAHIVDPPDWFMKWASIDDALLFTVEGECEAHDADYFPQYDPQSPDDAKSPRVVIVSTLSTPNTDKPQ